jgi:hypothetical protein
MFDYERRPTMSANHLSTARAHQVAIYRAMPPAERLRQALRMNRTMRELLAAGFNMRHPEWDDAKVRRAVADRILYARTG